MNEFIRKDTNITDYMVCPKQIIFADSLNETEKILYILLLDRIRLSKMNADLGWIDTDGRIFMHYTIQSLAHDLSKSEMTIKNALRTLEQADLISRVRQGIGSPNRIYVKIPAVSVKDNILSINRKRNFPCDGQNTLFTGDRNLSSNKNKNQNIQEDGFLADYFDYQEGSL